MADSDQPTGTNGPDDGRDQIFRLRRLTDVVYAVALVLIIQWFPLPEEVSGGGELRLVDVWTSNLQGMIAALIGLLFVIIYWLRSNTLLSAVDDTDNVHAGLSIASVFCLLMLLYMVRVGEDVVESSRRAGESFTMALIGLTAGAAWWRARRKGLVRKGMTNEEAVGVQVEAFAEPLTALITIPFAFVGELAWNLSWLAYIPVSAILRRRGVR